MKVNIYVTFASLNTTTNKYFTTMARSKKLVGRKAQIISDNENYTEFMGVTLVITHASNEGAAYDSSLFPEMLCDFECEDGREFPFALYEYEFQLI